MKNNAKSFFNRKDLRVLSKKETSNVKGGNATSDSTTNQGATSDIVIEDLIQI